ncbi:hypothetical protein HDU86_000100 [Geranomyces michiganensis]|nr:hypothetical protein HDU86_000100 [Geranomyces michiganensis]
MPLFRRRRTDVVSTPQKRRPFAFRPHPLLLAILSAIALGLTVSAYRSSEPWFEQRVGYGVTAVSGLSGTMTLDVTVKDWCLIGFPNIPFISISQLDTANPAACKPIDMCAISDEACIVMKVVKGVSIASIALIAFSLAMSLLLLCHHSIMTPCTYMFLLLSTLLTVVADAALLIYFNRLKTLIPPRIPDIVTQVSAEASRFVNTLDGGNSYGKPHTFLIVSAALMGAAFLITLFSACFERCGRRVKSHSVDARGNPMVQTHETVRV